MSDAAVYRRPADGRFTIDALAEHSAIVLQYNPFMYGPRGFAPWLVLLLWRLRRRQSRPAIGIMVHEPYVALDSWRHWILGPYQRVQLSLLARLADIIFASIETWTASLARTHRATPCQHLPMGSTIPRTRTSRAAERRRLDIPTEALVLAILGSGHPSRRIDLISETANALVRAGRRVVLLNLGDGAPRLAGLDREVDERRPGMVSAERLSRQLVTADLFLAPFVDGVSTRRTSLMAALQHGLPVLGTDGHLTDQALRSASDAMRLVRIGTGEAYVAAALQLAADPQARARMSSAATTLYERNFAWSIAAERLLSGLRGVSQRPTRAESGLEATSRAS